MSFGLNDDDDVITIKDVRPLARCVPDGHYNDPDGPISCCTPRPYSL